jgi:hypothetical protein
MMAINVQKLLPPSKLPSAISLSSKVSNISIQKGKNEANRLNELSQKYNESNVEFLRKSLIDIDVLLKSILGQDKKVEETRRLRSESEEVEKRESQLELPKEQQKKFSIPKVSIPGMSFLDRAKRFIFFTGVGWLFTKFQDQLPKLKGIISIITPIYSVVETVFKFILSSVVSFVERGYEAYDKVRSLVKSIGGEKAQQEFDALSSKLNEYINYVLIGGMALSGAISAFASNVSKVTPPKAPVVTRPKVTVGRGGTPVPRNIGARITTSGGKVLTKEVEKSIAKNFIKTTVKPVLSRLPIVGGLIEFGLSWALGDPVGKAAFRGIGSVLIGAVGAAIGGPIGAAVGGLAGGEIGGRLYDYMFGGQKQRSSTQGYANGGLIRGYAQGGGVLGYSGIGRTIKIERQEKTPPPQQSTQPGKDVGGQSKIKKLFPNPNENPLTYGNPNPYYALTESASDFKSAPYGLGSLMGGAIDVALGQKMSDMNIMNAAIGLENMFYENYDREKNYIDVKSIIFGVIKSAASSALMNIDGQIRKKEKEKEKEQKSLDQTQTATREQVSPSGATGGVDVSGAVVGYVGSTGRSSGPHIHIETGDGYSGKGGEIPGYVLNNIIVDGKPLFQHPRGDGLGAGRGHRGFDFPIRNGAPIVLKGGLKFVEYDEGYNEGYGNSLIIADSSGRKYLIGHLSGGPSNPKQIKELQERQKAESVGRLDNTSSSKIEQSVGPVPKGGTLTFDQLYNVARQAGFSESNAKVAAAVAMAESSGNSGAHNDNPNTGDNSYGLWQINMIGRMGPERRRQFGLTSNEQLLDPLTNAKAAYRISGGSNFGAWTTYRDGKHVKFLPKAKQGGLISSINQSGNYIPQQSPKLNTESLQKYPSYSKGGTKVAIQRVIVEKMVPIPMSNKSSTDFMIAGGGGGLNNMSAHRG